jgi:hypothetical protein
LLGSQAQSVDVIFDFLILLGFLPTLDRERYCLADEVRSQLKRVNQQTWSIIALLPRSKVVDVEATTTALCYAMGHVLRPEAVVNVTYDRERTLDKSST